MTGTGKDKSKLFLFATYTDYNFTSHPDLSPGIPVEIYVGERVGERNSSVNPFDRMTSGSMTISYMVDTSYFRYASKVFYDIVIVILIPSIVVSNPPSPTLNNKHLGVDMFG